MRKLISGMALVAMLVSVPVVAHAQRRAAAPGGAKHEFGVDVGVAYAKYENVDGGIELGTPLDVRVGLVSGGKKMMWEPRFTLGLTTFGGTTAYDFEPGVNVLFANSPGGHRNGMYITGGAGLVLADDGTNNGTAFSLNGGVGWRKPYGGAAWRYELGFKYTSEQTDIGIPSLIEIGARIGISLWH
jgi:hypothetical protein